MTVPGWSVSATVKVALDFAVSLQDTYLLLVRRQTDSLHDLVVDCLWTSPASGQSLVFFRPQFHRHRPAPVLNIEAGSTGV